MEMQKQLSQFFTDRCEMHIITENDSDLVLSVLNSAGFIKYVGDRQVKTLEAASDYIRDRMLPQYRKYGYGNYCITRKSDQAKMGMVGFFIRSGNDHGDVGFSILPQYEGYGYVYEAATGLIDILSKVFNITTFHAIVMPENDRSVNLIKRLGMSYLREFKEDTTGTTLAVYERQITTNPPSTSN